MTRAADEEYETAERLELYAEALRERRMNRRRMEQIYAWDSPPEPLPVRCACGDIIDNGDGASECYSCGAEVCFQCRIRLNGEPYCRECALQPVEVER